MKSFIYPVPAVDLGEPPPGFVEWRWQSDTGVPGLAWYHPGPPDSALPPLLFFHGNGENLETLKWSGLYDRLIGLGTAALVVEYPGYGPHGGEPAEESLKGVATTALERLREESPLERPVVCGWSLGAALAVHLAATRASDVAGLVALSPWSSLTEVARVHFPGWLVSLGLQEEYDSLSMAAEVRARSLLIHGEADRIIPVAQGRRLARAMADSRWVSVPGAGHNDLLGFAVVWQEIERFVHGLRELRGL